MDIKVSSQTVLPIFLNHSDIWSEVDNRSWVFELTDSSKVWDSKDFEHVIAGIRNIPNIKFENKPEVLEVIAEEGKNAGYVLEVAEVRNISKYCYAESPVVVPHTFTSRIVRVKEQICPVFPLNIASTVRDNRTVAVTSELGNWDDIAKLYFLKKEFVFTDNDSHIRYVIRLTRNVIQSYMTMALSDVTKRPVEYEFTMEVMPSIKSVKFTPEERSAHILSCILRLIQIIRQEAFTIDSKTMKDVIQGYKSLIEPFTPKPRKVYKPNVNVNVNVKGGSGIYGLDLPAGTVEGVESIEKQVDTDKDTDKDTLQNKEDLYLLAPKPVTLEIHHLSDPGSGYGIITIQTGYAVTDKADGERMLMYIDKEGIAYLIDNSLEIKSMGLRTVNKDMFNSLVDGEYVSLDKMTGYISQEKDIFAAFDIYFANNQSVMKLPLITKTAKPSRYEKLKHFFEPVNWQKFPKNTPMEIELRVKTHIAAEGTEMFAACRKMLDMSNNQLPYEIDGLIFTPIALPVFGTYESGGVSIPRGAKWDRVFKWKPSEQNTIDFLVKKVGNPCGLSLNRYQEFELNTGYNAQQIEPVKVLTALQNKYDYKTRNVFEDNYIAKPFKPEPSFGKNRETERAYFPMDQSGRVIALNNDIISDNDIVEIGFDSTKKGAYRWFPLRVRYDKVKKYKKTGTISGNVNDYSTAMNIWRSIHNPVTKEMICGEKRLGIPDETTLEEVVLGSENVYYDKQVEREHALSLNMLNFHTHGIKGMLYGKLKDKNTGSLLELACGKAGDLNRWRTAGIQFILGVDLGLDNIQNPKDGAYTRLRNISTVLEKNSSDVIIKRFNVVFTVGDIAKPLKDGSAAKGIDDDSVKVLKMVYGKEVKGADKVSHILSGKASKGFDAVSIQFAIHYMFENEKLLDGFLSNVSSNLKDGGIFIGTCMDGVSVFRELAKSKGVIEGKKSASGNADDTQYPIWAILRKYEEKTVFDIKPVNAYGKKVDVYLEMTGQLIPEFLVHFDLLCNKCKKFGLELSETGLFDTEYNNYINSNIKFKNKTANIEMENVQKQFSFLNRWFVFTKKSVKT